MEQEKLFEATQNATEKSLGFTHSVIEKSKKYRAPSPKVNRIGTAIGSCIGGGLLVTGGAFLFAGKSLLAIGPLLAGASTIVSNIITHRRSKK